MDPTPTILRHFDSLRYAPPKASFTVLAAFFLTSESEEEKKKENDTNNGDVKIIGMATGTKCLPTKIYSRIGDAVHDFHAEVVARRCAVRWLLQEMANETSEWLVTTDECGRSWSLRQGVSLGFYTSELPCMYTQTPLETFRNSCSQGRRRSIDPGDRAPPAPNGSSYGVDEITNRFFAS